MSKFQVIVSDPAWSMSDKLTMSTVKRGAASNYSVLDVAAIKALDVKSIAADDAVLALWVPSAIIQDGLDTMTAWGFTQKQTAIWTKIKKSPLASLKKQIYKSFRDTGNIKQALEIIDEFDVHEVLDFNLGRLLRQTHEICLIGTRGKVYDKMMDRSQRSVHFAQNMRHSQKPEHLQDQLDIIFPDAKKLEMFARRKRSGWTCLGLEIDGKDIRDEIERLKKR